MNRQQEIMRGMLLAVSIYMISLIIYYFRNEMGESIFEFFANRYVLKSLLLVLGIASIPNVILFVWFVNKNWLMRARGILTMLLVVLMFMLLLKFVV